MGKESGEINTPHIVSTRNEHHHSTCIYDSKLHTHWLTQTIVYITNNKFWRIQDSYMVECYSRTLIIIFEHKIRRHKCMIFDILLLTIRKSSFFLNVSWNSANIQQCNNLIGFRTSTHRNSNTHYFKIVIANQMNFNS